MTGKLPAMRHLLLPLTALLLAAAPAALAQPVPAAMVIDAQGAVKLARGATAIAAEVTADLPLDTRIEMGPGARLVLLVHAAGEEVSLAGPVTAVLARDGVSGTPPAQVQRRKSAMGSLPQLRRGVTPGAYVMRASRPTARLRPLTLSGTRTLEERPVFRWATADASGPFTVAVLDETGQVIHEARTESPEYALPASIALREGVTYSWEVSARNSDGTRFASVGDFAIADGALRQQVRETRPAEGAPFAAWVTWAAWLQAQELHDEARGVWRKLSAQRPDDARLKALAGG